MEITLNFSKNLTLRFHSINDLILIETYNRAVDLKMNKDFIALLKNELDYRNLSPKMNLKIVKRSL